MRERRALIALVLAACVAGCAAARERFAGPDVLFIATPEAVSLEMLKVAAVTKDDVVFDLGSGDGRVVIAAARDFGAHGVGVEIDPKLVSISRDAALAAGVASHVSFLWQDLFVTDLSGATVVTLYLRDDVNLKLRPKLLRELPAGTRVVSHDFDMGDWEPDRVVPVRTREREHRLYFWVIPARVGGVWRVRVDEGEATTLTLVQTYRKLAGILGNLPASGRVSGDRIELVSGAMTLRGMVRGDVIEGEIVSAGAQTWEAHRVQD